MSADQKYNRTRKRAEKFSTSKLEPDEATSRRKQIKTENPIITWVKKDWTIIVGLIIIFFISLFLRAYFYYPVATENGWLLSGNDPFYHKRVIDYAQQYFTHIRFDPLLDYPLIGVNPRPPAYDWSNAIMGLFLSPLANGDASSSTWFLFLLSPALWGALTIFPVYFLTKDIFGRKPAILSAFFMGIMSSHIERSPLGFSDHDAMVVFFVVTSILFLAKALGHLKERYWVKRWSNPVDVTTGIRDFFAENPAPIAFSILCGISMGTVALIWKGFPYVFVIIMLCFLIITFINHLRKVDSLGIFLCIFIAFAVALLISFPYYAFFTTGTWIDPLYMMFAVVVIGIFFIPTRDLPWIVVFPTFIILSTIAVLILSYVQPESVEALFTGGGYFVKSKLYNTIAEAQAPDTSRLAISYGPITFYLTLIGLVLAMIQIPKHWKMDYFLIIVWCALAIYMAMSAVRFMFNATPVFAVLSGWITWSIFERLDPTFRTYRKIETKFVYLYIGILTLLITTLGYWWLYLQHDNYAFYQILFGIGLFGIFVAIFTAWIILKYNIYVGILIYVTYIVIWIWYSFDKLINLTFEGKEIIWDKFPWEQFGFSLLILGLVFIPIVFFIFNRHRISGSRLDMKHIAIALFMVFMVLTPNLMFAIDASIPYEKKPEYDPAGKTFGAFGHSFPSEYWQHGLDWLAEQDNEFVIEERPAFISWWDYGFWTIYLGEHPTVADNFQAGYQLAGSFIASTNETQGIALFAVRIIEGDYKAKPRGELNPEVEDILIRYCDNGDTTNHPNTDKIIDLLGIETASSSTQKALIKEIESNPKKYGKLTDIKIRNAKYAAVRAIIESNGMENVVNALSELNQVTGNSIRYFAVDTRLFPFSAQNTGIFYAPITLADRDVGDFIKYYAMVDVRDNTQSDWRSYSDQPVPTEEVEDEIDLMDIVETHGENNVRIQDYSIKYTDDFYNSMFYKCYIGYTYEDIYGTESGEMREVPGMFGNLASFQTPPMPGWNMTHFRAVYRSAYWTPHNESELKTLPDRERDWQVMSELDALKRITSLESDGKDNDNNDEIDDRGEGGTWSSAHTGGGVFFLKYYHGAIVHGQILTEGDNPMPVPGVRVTVLDDFGVPHDSIFTDADGNYNVTVPFGFPAILVSKDGYGGEEELEQRRKLIEQTILNRTFHEITDKQAMRQTSNYIIKDDITIPVGSTNGRIYFELTGDENYNLNEDKIITEAKLILNSTNKRYNLSYTTEEIDDEGNFEIDGIVPGDYTLFAEINGHTIEHSTAITISAEQFNVEQDFPIKQAIISGNATFINNTEFQPGNVTIRLQDLTNNTGITSTLKSDSPAYSFTELLPGDYLISINETGLQYFEETLNLVQDDNITKDIDLVPVISVSGNVYYNPDILDPMAGEIAPNAHVVFYNNDNINYSTTLEADKVGNFNGIVSKGNYSVYIHYLNNGKDFVHLSSINIVENKPIELTLYIEPGFWISGVLTKQAKTTVPQAEIQFILMDDNDNFEANIFVQTNSKGEFRIFLPHREYKIEIFHISDPGNTTYTYYNSSSYLESDVDQIIQENVGSETNTDSNNPPARTNSDSRGREVNHNIHLDEPSRIWGYVYWDRNFDNKFLTYNQSEDNNTPSSGSRQNETTFYSFEGELGGPENELVIGAKMVFQHENGTLVAYTNEEGYYSIFLPPFMNYFTIDDSRFKPLADTNPANKTSIFISASTKAQIEGIARNFSVIPVNTTIAGYTWFDIDQDDVFDIDEAVPNVSIKIHPLLEAVSNDTSSGGSVVGDIEPIELTSDPITGAYEIDLLPGEYAVSIDFDETEITEYSYDNLLFVPLNRFEQPVEINFGMIKGIFTNLTITTEDFALNQSNLENVSINLYFDSVIPVQPSPFTLNGSFYTGSIFPNDYTIWAEYIHHSGTTVVTETKYLFFGMLTLNATKNKYTLVMRKPVEFNLKTFVDEDGSGNFTGSEERPSEINVTITETSGGVFELKTQNNTLNQLLMPGTSYSIHINDTRKQPAETHGIKTVRYLHDSVFTLPSVNGDDLKELDILLSKYYLVSGRVYYDDNENGKADPPELNEDVTIHFTGPEGFTLISNETGRYERYMAADEYFVEIEDEGFLSRPQVYSYNVSLENTSFDISEAPIKVKVFGFTFYDADADFEFIVPETTGGNSDTDHIVGGAIIEFTKNIFTDPAEGGFDDPGTPEEGTKIEVKSNSNTGAYEALLDPGEYSIYVYREKDSVFAYASLDLRLIEHLPVFEYNISLYDGRLVEGNVFLRDTDLNEVHDLYSEESGTGIRWESMEGVGSRFIQFGRVLPGVFDSLYLPYGNYSVTTDYISEEYEMNMEYELNQIIFVNEDSGKFSLELNKKLIHEFILEVVGDSEKELQTGDYHQKAFTIKVENEGNVFNVIKLRAEDVPTGWIVSLSNRSVPLDITGKYSTVLVTVDITIPVNTLAENNIKIIGTASLDESVVKEQIITVNTPAIYGFELGYEDDLNRGIKFNDTLKMNLTVKNIGNANDELIFKFSHVPEKWNISIGEAWRENTDVKYQSESKTFVHTIEQTDVYKNLTIQVVSPMEINASLDEGITFIVGGWSKNKPSLEYNKEMSVTIRNPELSLEKLKILNADLTDGNNVTIRTTVKNTNCYVENVNFTLYINDVLMENRTVNRIEEDTVTNVDFSWNPIGRNFTGKKGANFRFKVVINSDFSITEEDYDNNLASERKFIGVKPEVEEYNWRPLLAMLTLLIVFLVIYAVYRWRKKI
jgi:asparagine N-glycosylation enzyme membrane subunit Stt3